MSDGIIDTGNPQRDLKSAETMRGELAIAAVEADIRIFAIAFTDNADIQLMLDLAEATNGRYFQPMQPGDLAGVFAFRDASPSPKAADAAIPALPGAASSPEVPALPEPLPEMAIREETRPMTYTPLPDGPFSSWRAGWMPVVAAATVGFSLLLSVVSVVLLYRLFRGPRLGPIGLEGLAATSRNLNSHALRAVEQGVHEGAG
jgi:hypothetical protein